MISYIVFMKSLNISQLLGFAKYFKTNDLTRSFTNWG